MHFFLLEFLIFRLGKRRAPSAKFHVLLTTGDGVGDLGSRCGLRKKMDFQRVIVSNDYDAIVVRGKEPFGLREIM